MPLKWVFHLDQLPDEEQHRQKRVRVPVFVSLLSLALHRSAHDDDDDSYAAPEKSDNLSRF